MLAHEKKFFLHKITNVLYASDKLAMNVTALASDLFLVDSARQSL